MKKKILPNNHAQIATHNTAAMGTTLWNRGDLGEGALLTARVVEG